MSAFDSDGEEEQATPKQNGFKKNKKKEFKSEGPEK